MMLQQMHTVRGTDTSSKAHSTLLWCSNKCTQYVVMIIQLIQTVRCKDASTNAKVGCTDA